MKEIALLKGDGIGPEISDALVSVIQQLKAPIKFVDVACGEETLKTHDSAMPSSAIEKIRELKVAIKGPTGTPIGKGRKSANVTLRRSLDLFANLRPIRNLPGVLTPFKGVDLIVVRENTEDLYAAVEHQIAPGVMQSLKIISRPASERIFRYAFTMAQKYQRKKVTCVHKANIMKMCDGMFLEIFREVAKEFPNIEATDIIVDNLCMQLVTKPQQFDVLVTENLYGDIISDLCAGLVGGLGVAGGANIGDGIAVFEAVHGTAPDIAGQDKANPTAMILSGIMMLEYLEMFSEASKLRTALEKTLSDGRCITRDLKGSAGTAEFSKAIVSNL